MSTVELDFPTASTAAGPPRPVAVLGGGPAGLTAGYLLAQRACP